ncbi:hypothetical protein GE061_017635 [Apolygus lucorum]|uniref:Uncharacterized protein n=1 Tax=Apolygus lucorum TaxID=248454 RepID=A0A6A4J5E2_APOLU|nr:hypothetical protein GE061_017635 [Apolygus lucorum]
MTSLCGNFTSAPAGCYAELGSALSSAALGYVTLLLGIYVRCSASRREPPILFTSHTARCLLSLALFFVHLGEAGELIAGGKSWFLASMSFFSWPAVQFFYLTVEVFGKPQYLAVTSFLYLVIGFSRGVLLYVLIDQIDVTHIAVHLATFCSFISYGVALNDLVTFIQEGFKSAHQVAEGPIQSGLCSTIEKEEFTVIIVK